jgi:hypothetical protein
MSALRIVQMERGWLSKESISEVAQYLVSQKLLPWKWLLFTICTTCHLSVNTKLLFVPIFLVCCVGRTKSWSIFNQTLGLGLMKLLQMVSLFKRR